MSPIRFYLNFVQANFKCFCIAFKLLLFKYYSIDYSLTLLNGCNRNVKTACSSVCPSSDEPMCCSPLEEY